MISQLQIKIYSFDIFDCSISKIFLQKIIYKIKFYDNEYRSDKSYSKC